MLRSLGQNVSQKSTNRPHIYVKKIITLKEKNILFLVSYFLYIIQAEVPGVARGILKNCKMSFKN